MFRHYAAFLRAVSLLLVSVLCARAQHVSRDSLHLRGPVKSVRTEEPPSTPSRPRSIVTEQEFGPDGWLTEYRLFDANGNLVASSSSKRERGQLVAEESTQADGPKAGRTVVTRDPQGRASDVTTYNFDGTVKERTTTSVQSDGTHKTTYDSTGKIVSDTVQRTTPISGGFSSETTSDGKVIGETVVQRSPQHEMSAQSANTPEGHVEQRIVRDQQQGTTNTRIEPDGRRTTTTRDADGRTLTIENVLPNGHTSKSLRHFDERNREIGDESYRDGALVSKTDMTYEDDDHGNWIRKITHSCNGAGQCQPPAVSAARTISYY